ncbi:hypothetical protein OF83DRAFT_1080008 [Amylostereum chailletii]|nr:hypothetical protein OF83DRAFT_1080008 [Amylostereum chailletii]
MAPPRQLVQWLERTYPRPKIDPEWLNDCYDWVITEHHLDPAKDMPKIIEYVNVQLLSSNLADSMIPGTGIPATVAGMERGHLSGPPVLVQITTLTDIGHSAFSLMNTRQTRIDKEDLAGLAEDDGGEDDGPIPRYPRSMLRFTLSDGSTTLPAVEFERLPQLELGETPLGFKIQLRNPLIRKGIAFLDPTNAVLKGYTADELDEARDADFVRSLHLRMHPDATFSDEEDANERDEPAPEPAVRAPASRGPPQPPPVAQARLPAPPAPAPRPPSPVAGPSSAAITPGPAQRTSAKPPSSVPKPPSTVAKPPSTATKPSTTTKPLSTTPKPTTSHYFSTSATNATKPASSTQPLLSLPATRTTAAFIDMDNPMDDDPMADGFPPVHEASSDYDFGDDNDLNPSFFQEMDEFERRASGSAPASQVQNSISTPGASGSGGNRAAQTGRSTQRQRQRQTQTQTQTQARARMVVDANDVIEIDDDSDEAEKENAPVPQQRWGAADDDGVIVIDSD